MSKWKELGKKAFIFVRDAFYPAPKEKPTQKPPINSNTSDTQKEKWPKKFWNDIDNNSP